MSNFLYEFRFIGYGYIFVTLFNSITKVVVPADAIDENGLTLFFVQLVSILILYPFINIFDKKFIKKDTSKQ